MFDEVVKYSCVNFRQGKDDVLMKRISVRLAQRPLGVGPHWLAQDKMFEICLTKKTTLFQ